MIKIKSAILFRNLVILCSLISGFSSLVYEVTWHKYLENISGGEARSSAVILAVFLGALSIGYLIFGRWSANKKLKQPLVVFALLELTIGLWAFFFDHTQAAMNQQVLKFSGANLQNFLIELAVAILLIGLPSVLMGGTLPLITQSLSLTGIAVPKIHAKVYASNTFGAFVGSLTASFILVPTFGLGVTMKCAAWFNMAISLVIILITKVLIPLDKPNFTEDIEGFLPVDTLNNDSQEITAHREEKPWSLPLLRAGIIAIITGFCSISLQCIVLRLAGLSFGTSEYTFSMIVSLFVLMLAIGAWTVSNKSNVGESNLVKNQMMLTLGAIVVYLSVPFWGYLAYLVRIGLGTSKLSFYAYFAVNFFIIGIILACVLLSLGRAMPLIFALTRPHQNQSGHKVGLLYGLNAIGCFWGAVVGGYAAYYFMNLDSLFKICVILMSISVGLSFKSWLFNRFALFMTIMPVMLIMGLHEWDKGRLSLGLFEYSQEFYGSYSGKEKVYESIFSDSTLLSQADGPNATVAVYNYSIDETLNKLQLASSPANGLIQDLFTLNSSEQFTREKFSREQLRLQSKDFAESISSQGSSEESALDAAAESRESHQFSNKHTDTQNSMKDQPGGAFPPSALESYLNASIDKDLTFKKTSIYPGITVNGRSDGTVFGGELLTQKLLGHLPALFNTVDTQNAAVIGYGPGVTVGSLSLHDHIKNIDVFEMAEKVIAFAPVFNSFNHNAGLSPKVKWIEADAFRGIASANKKYDVIISGPSHPWVVGVERLYTEDFYKVAKNKLSSGGIYTQWFHTYWMSEETLQMVVDTFHAVFPVVHTFQGSDSDIILLGSLTPLGLLNLEMMEERLKQPEVFDELHKLNTASPYAILSKEVWHDTIQSSDNNLHTLEHPKLAYSAALDFFQEKKVDFWTYIERRAPERVASFSGKTLFATYDTSRLSLDPMIRRRQLQEICQTDDLEKIRTHWLDTARPCRSAIFLAMSQKLLDWERVGNLNLNDFFNGAGPISLEQAIEMIGTYQKLESAYSHIDTQTLIERTSVCHFDRSRLGHLCRWKLLDVLQGIHGTEFAESVKSLFLSQ